MNRTCIDRVNTCQIPAWGEEMNMKSHPKLRWYWQLTDTGRRRVSILLRLWPLWVDLRPAEGLTSNGQGWSQNQGKWINTIKIHSARPWAKSPTPRVWIFNQTFSYKHKILANNRKTLNKTSHTTYTQKWASKASWDCIPQMDPSSLCQLVLCQLQTS